MKPGDRAEPRSEAPSSGSATDLPAQCLRICFFNRSYPPDHGATGQLLSELAGDLARAGHDVWVIAGPSLSGDRPLSSGRGPRARPRGGARGATRPRATGADRGVNVLRVRATAFRPHRFAGRAANYLTYFASSCLAGLRVPRPDVVVALTDPPIVGLAALLAARRAGARFAFLCQDVFPEVGRLLEDFRSPAADRVLEAVNQFLMSRADRVIAVGETMRARLIAEKAAPPAKVVVIHNWADCAAIVPGPKINRLSAELGLSRSFVVMHAGNVGLAQGLEILLDAAERLLPDPAIAVAIVGDGAKREPLEALARARGLANVRFIPYQPRERLAELFAAADVFVISLRAGLAGYVVPSKLYGILAAGRPYVAAVDPVSEVAAITRAHGTGVVVSPGDGRALAEEILALYRDRALGEQLGVNGRRAALDYDRAAQVRRYEALFQALAADRRGR